MFILEDENMRFEVIDRDGKVRMSAEHRRCIYPLNILRRMETAGYNAKACKESVEIFLLRPDHIMPVIVRVPVSSKLTFLKYTTRLVGSLTPIYGVVTKITLTKATSKNGELYAQYNFGAAGALGPEETASAKAFGQKFMEILNDAAEAAIVAGVAVVGPDEEAV